MSYLLFIGLGWWLVVLSNKKRYTDRQHNVAMSRHPYWGRSDFMEVQEMSERQEHKRRYNRRLQFIAEFEKWLEKEPSMIRIISWWRWKQQRPVWEEGE